LNLVSGIGFFHFLVGSVETFVVVVCVFFFVSVTGNIGQLSIGYAITAFEVGLFNVLVWLLVDRAEISVFTVLVWLLVDRAEVRVLRRLSYARMFKFTLKSQVFLLPVMGTLVALGDRLRADTVFLLIIGVSILRSALVWSMITVVNSMAELRITISRVKVRWNTVKSLTKTQAFQASQFRTQPEHNFSTHPSEF
jgi:hypothetical protein